jgi:hypothetical protein
VAGSKRRLHSEELHKLYASPNIITMIKSGRMRWAGHVAHIGNMNMRTKSLAGRCEGDRPHGRPRR